jgi:hypothetical protein
MKRAPVLIVSGIPTANPSLLVLQKKGYHLEVRCYRKGDKITSCVYFATSDHLKCCADSAPELLGLVTLWETYGENWNQQEPDLLGEVSREEEDPE